MFFVQKTLIIATEYYYLTTLLSWKHTYEHVAFNYRCHKEINSRDFQDLQYVCLENFAHLLVNQTDLKFPAIPKYLCKGRKRISSTSSKIFEVRTPYNHTFLLLLTCANQ